MLFIWLLGFIGTTLPAVCVGGHLLARKHGWLHVWPVPYAFTELSAMYV